MHPSQGAHQIYHKHEQQQEEHHHDHEQQGEQGDQQGQEQQEEPPTKKKRVTTTIACENCRRMKVRCDSETPCARCARKKLECVYVESKKKKPADSTQFKLMAQSFHTPSPFAFGKVNSDKLVIPANAFSFTWAAASSSSSSQSPLPDSVRAAAALMREYLPRRNHKEANLATVYVMNFYIDLYFTRLSYLIHEPLEFFKKHFAINTKQGKLMLFSLLSLFFRNDGNLPTSNEFLNHAVALSKDLYDDSGTKTSLYSGLGFSLLGNALFPVDLKKARFSVKLANQLLEDSFTDNHKLNVIRHLVMCLNKTLFAKPEKNESQELLNSFKALSVTAQPKPSELKSSFPPPPNPPQPDFGAGFNLFETTAQKELVHKVMAKMHPDLFEHSDLTTDIDPQAVFKLSLVESFMFIHEILGYFLPQLSHFLDEITEANFIIEPGSISPEDGNFLLYLIYRMEKACLSMPNGEPLKTADVFFMQCLVFRAIGKKEEALEAARRSMEFTFTRVNIADMNPVFRVVVPLMHDAACLIQHGYFDEADTVVPHIERFVDLYPQARQALQHLGTVKLQAKAAAEEEAQRKAAEWQQQGIPSEPSSWQQSSSTAFSPFSSNSSSSEGSLSSPYRNPAGENEPQFVEEMLDAVPDPSMIYTSFSYPTPDAMPGFEFRSEDLFDSSYPVMPIPQAFE